VLRVTALNDSPTCTEKEICGQGLAAGYYFGLKTKPLIRFRAGKARKARQAWVVF